MTVSDNARVTRPSFLSDRIARELRRRIASGDYPPNSYLPSERDLAKEFAISRKTVTSALDRLVSKGLVSRAQGRGTQVRGPAGAPPNTTTFVYHGLFGPSSCIRPEAAGILTGIEQALRDRQQVFDMRSLAADRAETWQQRVERVTSSCSAAVFVEASDPILRDAVRELGRRRFPVVVANHETQDDLGVNCTCVNHRKCVTRAVELLVGLGHRRIAYIGRRNGMYFYPQAEQGYRDGMAQAQIDVRDDYIIGAEGMPSLGGFLAAKTLLALPHPPSAIITARDGIAEGAWKAIEDAGLMVGRDVSLVGFDDVSASWEESSLTTFREPCEEMGRAAVELLMDQIVQGWQPPQRREIESKLVIRRSAGPFIPT